MKRILVTGAGGSASINFINCLRITQEKFYIVGGDVNKFHLELPNVDKAYLLPYYDSKGYIPMLNRLIKKERIQMIHAQPDVEVEVISENREKLKAITFLPSKSAIKICRNKIITNKLLEKNNVPVPRSFLIKRIEDIPTYMKTFRRNCDIFWLRAVKGAGSRAALPVKTYRQAKEWIHYWRTMRELESQDFMISEYLPGREFAFQSIWRQGQLITSQARERKEYIFGNLNVSGQSSTPAIAKTVYNGRLNKIATRAVLVVDKNATGVFCIDLKENSKGIPCVTEINIGRFFTTSNFIATIGSNMPYYYVKLAFGEELPDLSQYNATEKDIYWVRALDALPVVVKENRLRYNKI